MLALYVDDAALEDGIAVVESVNAERIAAVDLEKTLLIFPPETSFKDSSETFLEALKTISEHSFSNSL